MGLGGLLEANLTTSGGRIPTRAGHLFPNDVGPRAEWFIQDRNSRDHFDVGSSRLSATISPPHIRLQRRSSRTPSPPPWHFMSSRRARNRKACARSNPSSPRVPSPLGFGRQARAQCRRFPSGRCYGTLAHDERLATLDARSGRESRALVQSLTREDLTFACSGHAATARAPSASAKRRTCLPSPSRSGFADTHQGS